MAHEPSVDLVDLVLVYEKEGTLDDLRDGEKGKEREKGQAGDQTKSGSSEAKREKLLESRRKLLRIERAAKASDIDSPSPLLS